MKLEHQVRKISSHPEKKKSFSDVQKKKSFSGDYADTTFLPDNPLFMAHASSTNTRRANVMARTHGYDVRF